MREFCSLVRRLAICISGAIARPTRMFEPMSPPIVMVPSAIR